MFSKIATARRAVPAVRRGLSSYAATQSGSMRNVATAAAAAVGVASGVYYLQETRAQSASTVMQTLTSISDRLATIEDALGINFQADIEKINAIKVSHPGNRAIKFFDVNYFNSLSVEKKKQLLKIMRSGIENADSGMGCYAMNPSDYDEFKPYLDPIIRNYHGVPAGKKQVNNWNLKGIAGLPADGKLDVTKLGLPALSMRVRVGRNLADFPLPGAMTKEDRIALENKMREAFEILKKKFGGRYHSITPGSPDFINKDEYNALVKAHIMFKDMAADTYLSTAGIASDWPYGRGCYVSEDKGFIIWVGEEDHLRIMCMKKGTVINDVFDRLKFAIDTTESIPGLSMAMSPDYGVVTSCPTNLGTGMRASVHMKIPKLTAGGSDKRAKEVCRPLGLSVRGMGGEHTAIGADGTCDISPSARFCISEAEIVTALYTGIKNLKAEEDKL